jgi:hypothetical protein
VNDRTRLPVTASIDSNGSCEKYARSDCSVSGSNDPVDCVLKADALITTADTAMMAGTRYRPRLRGRKNSVSNFVVVDGAMVVPGGRARTANSRALPPTHRADLARESIGAGLSTTIPVRLHQIRTQQWSGLSLVSGRDDSSAMTRSGSSSAGPARWSLSEVSSEALMCRRSGGLKSAPARPRKKMTSVSSFRGPAVPVEPDQALSGPL